MHALVPEHAPDQPANSELASGFATSVTCVPLSKFAVHAAPQLIPAGLLVTVPPPVPALWMVSPIDKGEVSWGAWDEPQPVNRIERIATEQRREATFA